MIYADNAATTQLYAGAFEAMKPYLLGNYANPSQPYSFSRESKKALKQARTTVADCIGAAPEEIFFTSGGTESDNWAIKGSAFSDASHRAIITSQIEHHAILNSCSAIERLGYPVTYLPVNGKGIVSPETIKSYITERTRLVSIMIANNEIGTIQPIRELSDIAHQYGAVFHTDAVQAVGHIPIDVQNLGVDMLSASAHKFNGPRGIGFLYIRHGTSIASLMDGGSQENGMRAGTENIAAIIGMAEALRWNTENMEKNNLHLRKVSKAFLDSICGLDYVLNGHPVERLPGSISISVRNQTGEGLMHLLDFKGIMVSTGSACDSAHTQVSHVIQAIGVSEDYAKGTLRITFGNHNTEEEARFVADELIKLCIKERRRSI